MQTCPLYPLLHGSKKSNGTATARGTETSTACGSAGARRWLAVSITLLGWTGWHALRDLLSAIPDSNDDFGLF
ncbi:hypothetical protein SAMN05443245_4234 [Paraburkholderia fungorum]|uniref:Uncharacterized protein n=1 Tax=Paraburkholderia fungorum TaxID=134537 RepID=A0A1H1HT00_9BURK|nr:hypothetical protein [Paraburkholderia fungorum]SDR28278.1 hypothetical protein SAMN05443245_4234 [Paraburkholderia fungorum]